MGSGSTAFDWSKPPIAIVALWTNDPKRLERSGRALLLQCCRVSKTALDVAREHPSQPSDLPRREGQRKGRAIVPMTGSLRAALLEARKAALSDYVVEWAGGPVKSIKKGFKAAAIEAGLPDVSPHVLRHTAAVHMAEAGVSMEEIAQFLGHSNSRITESVYARYSPDHLRKAADALEFE